MEICNDVGCLKRDVIRRHLFSGDVLEYCLQVVETGPVSIQDLLFAYQHGGLEHVYYSVSFSRGIFKKSTLNARTNPPLEIIWSWIFMLLARAEWAYISRRIMDEPMPNHFIFALESPPTRTPRTPFNWAIMGPFLRMHICM